MKVTDLMIENKPKNNVNINCWVSNKDAGQHSTENCLICGHKLEYSSLGKEYTCYHCGKKDFGNINCPKGHYICDQCHGLKLYDTIQGYIISTASQNPFEIAEHLLNSNKVPMLGCENAWIAAGALMAALKNVVLA